MGSQNRIEVVRVLLIKPVPRPGTSMFWPREIREEFGFRRQELAVEQAVVPEGNEDAFNCWLRAPVATRLIRVHDPRWPRDHESQTDVFV